MNTSSRCGKSDQIRGELYGITDELEIIQMHLASSPNCQPALTKF